MTYDDIKLVEHEMNITSDLSHPNILKPYELFEDDKRLYLITDYCSGGELYDHIINQDGPFEEAKVAHIIT